MSIKRTLLSGFAAIAILASISAIAPTAFAPPAFAQGTKVVNIASHAVSQRGHGIESFKHITLDYFFTLCQAGIPLC